MFLGSSKIQSTWLCVCVVGVGGHLVCILVLSLGCLQVLQHAACQMLVWAGFAAGTVALKKVWAHQCVLV